MTGAAEWSGRVGDAWAGEWQRTDRSFAGLSQHLDTAILHAAPQGSGRAVDLGCGAGQTSIALAAARPDLAVLGVDLSADLIGVATERGSGHTNVRFAVADVAREANMVAAGADLLFSRQGVMFFDDPGSVFAALRDAVAPGGRLVFSCFRAPALNPWAGELAAAAGGQPQSPPAGYAPGPFGFADAAWVAAMLERAGWRAAAPRPVDYDYVAGEGADPVADAVAFFRRIGPVASAIAAVPDADRPAMLGRLATALESHRKGERISFPAAAWIWSAHA